MRILTPFVLLLVLLCGCRAFKPSADLQKFEPYFVKQDSVTVLQPGQVKVTFFGTSTLLFDDGETQLLIDGFFSRPPLGKVAFGKVRSDLPVIQSVMAEHGINRLKGIFVCHSHYDHAMDAPAISKLTGAKVFGSPSTLNICKGENLAEGNMQLFEPGKEMVMGKFSITVINSKHTPPFKLLGKTNATDPEHPNIVSPLKQPAKVDHYIEGGTYDFYIKHGNHAVLVKASTNYIEGALDKYPAGIFFLGAAMLGVQADTFQNNYYNNTVRATGAKIVVPIHWDNFMKPLTKPLIPLPNISDNVDSSFNYLIRRTKEDKIKLQLMQGNNSITLF
ncbi:MAG TPA: MBL fold metallo-hydrolase [Chitinophagales bacterium]|nr:MBL fold metallo-hydrolase [Chitinophagales bacterium]